MSHRPPKRHPRASHAHRAPPGLVARDDSDCISSDPAETVTDRLNKAFESGGQGYKLQLCPGETYTLTDTIFYTAPGQELSTAGYPTGDERATLVVNGPVMNGQGHTTAVDGTCPNCGGVRLRNVQINGTRGGASPTGGGANIEMGGSNSDQLIEYVRSYDPRSWSCLHVAEGGDTCSSITVQNNDIGPAGVDVFQQWADGISVACRNSIVRNNVVHNPTDGGIVIFGSPGTQVYNNTIEVHNVSRLLSSTRSGIQYFPETTARLTLSVRAACLGKSNPRCGRDRPLLAC